MERPVIDPYGHSYEEEAIMKWISKDPRSPLTRQPLHVEDLKENTELKEKIEAWKKQNGAFSKEKS